MENSLIKYMYLFYSVPDFRTRVPVRLFCVSSSHRDIHYIKGTLTCDLEHPFLLILFVPIHT